MAYSADNAKDVSFANYTTGYLTYIDERGSNVYGSVYAVNDEEYHLVFNTTGNLASGYINEQLVFTSGNLRTGATSTTWENYATLIKKAIIQEEIEPKACDYYFSGLTALTEIENLNNMKTSKVKSMSYMFKNCSGLTSLDLSDFNTENVTTMFSMFNGCSGLTSLDLSSFNTENVTTMFSMFSGCSGLTSLDLSSFNTENVTTMYSMFYVCSGLTSLDLKGFNTENVTTMHFMFYNCKGMTSLNISNFKTHNVTDMYGMFEYCDLLTNLDLSGFDTRCVNDMTFMFYYCSNLEKIYVSDLWTTSAVTSSSYMLYGCKKLSGAVAYNSSNANDATFANYTTGYLTYKGE